MKTLEKLRAELREKLAAMKGLQEKAFAEESSEEDRAALREHMKSIKSIETQIEDMEEAERIEAVSSKLAAAVVAPAAVPAVAAEPKQVKDHEAVGILIAGFAKGKVEGKNPIKVLEDNGYGGFVQKIQHEAMQKGLNTLVSSEGGVLVPTNTVRGGIIPLLREASSFLSTNPTRVELINGGFMQARAASGASASYIAEGALKPISAPTFDSIDMRAKKLAGIVVLTEEMQRWAIENMVAYVTDDLRASMALTLDTNAWLGTGAGASPTGILNKAGVQTHTMVAATATAPTVAELDTMVKAMILKLTTNLFTPNQRWRWVMTTRTAMYIASLRVTNGDLAYPSMQGAGIDGNLSFAGIPVIIAGVLPTNGGGTTDEAVLALIDFTDVLYGEEMAVQIRMSDQATLTPNGTDLIHLWQSNQMAVLAESMHDFGLRRAKAVVKTIVRF